MKLHGWSNKIKKIKGIYHTMNKFRVEVTQKVRLPIIRSCT